MRNKPMEEWEIPVGGTQSIVKTEYHDAFLAFTVSARCYSINQFEELLAFMESHAMVAIKGTTRTTTVTRYREVDPQY